jgi:hypothetical protein
LALSRRLAERQPGSMGKPPGGASMCGALGNLRQRHNLRQISHTYTQPGTFWDDLPQALDEVGKPLR